MNIAIDGPGGAGKSTVAKRLAKKLGILYLDTGAMYRAVAYFTRQNGVDPAHAEAVKALLPGLELGVSHRNGEQIVTLAGADVTPFLRTPSMGMDASTVSKIPEVRLKLVEIQRQIAAQTDCVLDGRDIGSYVLPNADRKFFLTATPEVRAMRRCLELKEKNPSIAFEDVLKEINARDYQDTHREFAPLRCVEDAIVLDTTNMSIDEVTDTMERLICKS